MAEAGTDADQLLTLRIDGDVYGVPAASVREVARLPRLSRVPHAPEALLGLANIRGAVVPVLSLARLVSRDAGVARRVVVVDAGEPVGLAVEEVSRLVSAADATGVRAIDVAALIADSVRASGKVRRAQRGAIVADAKAEQRETVSLVIFAVGGQEFALPLSAVEQVLLLPDKIARMPDADAVVVGSVAVRGALLPMLSLRALLGLSDGVPEKPRVLMVRIGAHRIGMVVDAMRSILRVAEDDIDPVPQVLTRGGAETRIQAICRLEDGKRLVSVLAADQLLRDEITERLLQSGATEQADMAESEAEAASEQFLIFRIGEEEFGLPIGAVEEVAALPARHTPLPRAPAFVRGVMNLRGQVVPVIDQARRFGAESSAGAKRRVVVVRIGSLQAGFVVDSVSEVLRIEASALREAPDFGKPETRVFERVANLEEEQRIVLIVSPRELLDRAEQDLLQSLTAKGVSQPS